METSFSPGPNEASSTRSIGFRLTQLVYWAGGEARGVVQATWRQSRRLIRFAGARWKMRQVRLAALSAKYALGDAARTAGIGSQEQLLCLTNLDSTIRQAQAVKQSTTKLQHQRNAALLQLAECTISLTPRPIIIGDQIRQTEAAQDAERLQVEAVKHQRSGLFPNQSVERRQAVLGLLAIVIAIWLTALIAEGSLNRGGAPTFTNQNTATAKLPGPAHISSANNTDSNVPDASTRNIDAGKSTHILAFPINYDHVIEILGPPTRGGKDDGIVNYQDKLCVSFSEASLSMDVQVDNDIRGRTLAIKLLRSKYFTLDEAKAILYAIGSPGEPANVGRFEVTSRDSIVKAGMVLISIQLRSTSNPNCEPAYEGRLLSSWITQLKEGSDKSREDAAFALFKTAPNGGKVAIEALTLALNDGNEGVVSFSTQALALYGQDGINALASAIDSDNEKIRSAATTGMVLASKKAVPALIELLASERKLTVASASAALSKIGEPAIPELIEATRNSNFQVRGFAALSLGEIGPKAIKAVPALKLLLQDNHDGVRKGAAHALSKITK